MMADFLQQVLLLIRCVCTLCHHNNLQNKSLVLTPALYKQILSVQSFLSITTIEHQTVARRQNIHFSNWYLSLEDKRYGERNVRMWGGTNRNSYSTWQLAQGKFVTAQQLPADDAKLKWTRKWRCLLVRSALIRHCLRFVSKSFAFAVEN